MSDQENKISINGWDEVTAYLQRWLAPCRKLAVAGIGNDLRGDDGAGPRVAHLLAENPGNRDDLLIVDAGTVPENYVGKFIDENPTHILLVDAALKEELAPGAVHMVEEADIGNFSTSTHTMSLSLVISLVTQHIEVNIALLGIQPLRCEMFDETLSPAVETTVKEIAAWIRSKY